MCTQKPPHDYSAELYARYGNAFSAYIADRVLPALRGHSGEFLLSELWTRWSNHKLMVRWLSRFFNYLDRYYIARHTMHSLPEVGLLRFRDEVYAKVRQPAREALLAAVAAERAGEGSNRPLLKNVLSIFIEVGMGSMDCYQRDFEVGLVEATKEHYARVAAAWVSFLFFFLPLRASERSEASEEAFYSSSGGATAKRRSFVFFLRAKRTAERRRFSLFLRSGTNSGATKPFSCFQRCWLSFSSLGFSLEKTSNLPKLFESLSLSSGRGRLLPGVHGESRGRPPLRGGARRRLSARVLPPEADGRGRGRAPGVARRGAAREGGVRGLVAAARREARRPGKDVQAVRARAEGPGSGRCRVQGPRRGCA